MSWRDTYSPKVLLIKCDGHDVPPHGTIELYVASWCLEIGVFSYLKDVFQ